MADMQPSTRAVLTGDVTAISEGAGDCMGVSWGAVKKHLALGQSERSECEIWHIADGELSYLSRSKLTHRRR